MLTWGAVAHASGSGWVQALAALGGGVVLVGMIGPGLVVRRIELTIETSPHDAKSGQPFRVAVVATRSCRCVPLRPAGAPMLIQAARATELTLQADHRGVLDTIEVKVATAAPFGLLWWSSRRRLQLPSLLLVAPVRGPRDQPLGPGEPTDEARGAPQLSEHGERRGSRLYRLGDSPRSVDWRATAHTGSLMVRESELAADRPAHVVADLAEEVDLAERQASEILGTVAALLGEQRTVLLETTGAGGRLSARVADEREAGRRLARAGKNPWGELGLGP
ncbi:MAG: DUF58 domain-containing protein [Acidimicrobiales bacterium]